MTDGDEVLVHAADRGAIERKNLETEHATCLIGIDEERFIVIPDAFVAPAHAGTSTRYHLYRA